MIVEVLIAASHAVAIVALAFLIYKRQDDLRRFFWPALSFKLICGVCLGLIYAYYYAISADTFTFFREASSLATLAKHDFSSYLKFLFSGGGIPADLSYVDPRVVFLLRITSVFCLLTSNNYFAVGFYFSFISFLASWHLVKVLSRNIAEVRLAAVIAFLFLPSVVFWTSGLLKESLAMAALFFLTAVFLKAWFREKLSIWVALSAMGALWILWNLKYYYAGVFLAVVAATAVQRSLARKKSSVSPGIDALTWACIFVFPLVIITFLHPNFHLNRVLDVMLENNAAFNALSLPHNIIHYDDLQATPLSVLKNSPWALFSGLFRPFFWEASSLIQILPGIENTLLFLLFAASCFRIKNFSRSAHRRLILAAIVFVAVMSTLLALSAPNFGTLSRYRSGYISFFAFIVLCNNPVLHYVERSILRLVSK